MDKTEMLNSLFALAHNDLRSAEYLSTMTNPTPDEIICFHCQQSAEKYLKGFLVSYDILPPKTHDLTHLLEMCESKKSEFSSLISKCSFLNRYAVTVRYSFELQITTDDMKTAIQFAKDVKEFVLNAIANIQGPEAK